jgi:sarcosine oxidase, subunit gamma
MPKLASRGQVCTPLPLRYPTLSITEIPLSGILRLQGKSQSPAFKEGVERVTRFALPVQGALESNGAVLGAWATPGEWLLFCDLAEEQALLNELRAELSDVFANVALVSDSRLGFSIQGDSAADFLAKGGGMDVDSAVFKPGSCVTTRFAGLPAILMHVMSGEYRLYVDISFSGFISSWIADAAQEFESTDL